MTGPATPSTTRARRDLKAELLEHGVALARSGGPDAVSLRDVQRRAGVSNSAAYRHYADRDALLVAISEHAADLMAARMTEQMARVAAIDPDPDPDRAEVPEGPGGSAPLARARGLRARARLRATGRAYLDFAREEPGLFAVAMHPGVGAPGPGVAEGGGAETGEPGPYQLLVACVDDLVAVGELAPGRRPLTDVVAWSAVHGLAVLLGDGPLAELEPAERDAVTERLFDVVDAGIR